MQIQTTNRAKQKYYDNIQENGINTKHTQTDRKYNQNIKKTFCHYDHCQNLPSIKLIHTYTQKKSTKSRQKS